MLPANKTSEPVNDAVLYQRCFECERRAHQQAEQASATKSEFLAKRSHEIRTPMMGVIGMLEALRATGLDQQQHAFLKVAHESAETLLALINDILDFSKIDAGRMSLESVHFDLHCALNNIIQLWQPHAREKQLQLLLQIDPEVPVWLTGDSTRLSQILTNLISNALKFTSKGRITIQCDALTPAGIDPAMLRITVQDTGIGMSEEVCKRLFTAFERTDGATTSRVYDGTGLGLAICKQLAHLMEGEVSVESTAGVGSCFILILPFGIGTAPVFKPVTAVQMPMATRNTKHHLLVVDDNEINRRVALAMLDHLGFIASFACGGAEALKAVQNGSFSLVLMDCHMPVMDGFAAAQAMRHWEKDNGRIPMPIIAVSASAFQEDRDRCSDAGMNDFVSKPVTLTSLKSAIDRWLPAIDAVTTTQSPVVSSENQTSHTELPEHLFDRAQFEEMRMLTGDRFHPLLEKFCAEGLQQISDMRAAAATADAEAMRKCAHKLKGSSGTIGATALAKVCHRMEERARTGDIDNVTEVIESVAICLDEVIEVIDNLIHH